MLRETDLPNKLWLSGHSTHMTGQCGLVEEITGNYYSETHVYQPSIWIYTLTEWMFYCFYLERHKRTLIIQWWKTKRDNNNCWEYFDDKCMPIVCERPWFMHCQVCCVHRFYSDQMFHPLVSTLKVERNSVNQLLRWSTGLFNKTRVDMWQQEKHRRR